MSPWALAALGEVTNNLDYRRRPVKASDRIPGPYPYFGASGVVDHVGDYLFDGLHLLIAEDGENLRTRNTPVAFLADGKFWVNNHTHVVTANDRADTRFLCYALALMDIGGYLSGSTLPKLTRSAMDSIMLRLPPLSEQQAIAEVLGALDDKINTNHAASEVGDQLAETAFSRLHGIGSDQTSVGSLIESGCLHMSDGYRTKRSELGTSGYRIVRVADVRGGVVHLDSPDFVSIERSAAIGVKRGVPGDILLTTKGTVGRVAVLPPTDSPVVYSPQLCFFRVLSEQLIKRAFLRMWLTGAEFQVQASHRMNNTDMAPYINLADIKSLRITLPPMSDQAAISGLLDALENRSQAAHLENQTLAALRNTLLPELMSGRLRVKDAERTLEGVL